VLEDALKVGFTKNQGLIDQFLKRVAQQIVPLPYKHWYKTIAGAHGLRVKLQPAGHILGSAYVECEIGQPRQRIVFSGDVLVLESTYGDCTHPSRKDRRARLQALCERALKNQGTVLIPAFSIGCTQELLYELEELFTGKSRLARQGGAAG
jgi:metallo-beta-lactamase family protein